MEFKEFYEKFEAEVKKELSAALWDKACLKGDPTGFAKELFDSDVGFTAEEAAEEFVEMINTMKEQGEFDEAVASEPWSVTYKDIWDNEETETFETEGDAWARYNELSARTSGDMSDILWVEEPKGPVSEDGSSAASLGVGPNAAKKNESVSDKDVEDFLSDSLDRAVLGDDETINIKFIADGVGGFELRALLPSGENKLLKSGGLFAVSDYFRELLDMPMENAITLIENA